ncbi:MAG: hypothetical protein KatS3mg057_1106 [Herpetosiphonaceae bacterium]|nr:MAG: hypothetical protein KatS3mg057_1106 [Herpetosiphonaceae bacterium]
MDETTFVMFKVMIIALIGWLATAYWIKTRLNVRAQLKRLLIVPAWFPWMGLALGGPVYQGVVPSKEAISAGLSFTAGMLVYLFMLRRQGRRDH